MTAIFVLSPGRCGTQWLSEQWRTDSNTQVCHEPIHFDYAPTHNSPDQPLCKNGARITAHLHAIQIHLDKGGIYLECGFPSWRHIKWFQQNLDGNVKVIHIHRDPVENAISLLKLNVFVPALLPHLPEKQFFHPQAPAALLPEYERHWSKLTPFEKNLYYWAEVNLQAERFKSSFAPKNWLTIRFQQLFRPESLEQIADFTNISIDEHKTISEKIDRFDGIPQGAFNPQLIYTHPMILEIALKLGYSDY